MIETRIDAFLDGRVRLRQPVDGYRAAMDPVLLAAAVPARRRGRVLDLGCGVGAALFCHGARVPGPTLFGLEIDPDTAEIARSNAADNDMTDRVNIVTGDVLSPPPPIAEGEFDQVFANPPYMEADVATASPHPGRARSNVEGAARLSDWVDAMIALARPKGGLTMVHRADRLDDIIAALHGAAGDIEILPLWPRVGEPAKRIIVRARKGVRGGATMSPGLVLHGPPGTRYTREAEAVLRRGDAL